MPASEAKVSNDVAQGSCFTILALSCLSHLLEAIVLNFIIHTIHATLPYCLSPFAIAGEENQGNLCSKTTWLAVYSYTTSSWEVHTTKSMSFSLLKSLGFYYLNRVLPMSEIHVPQMIYFQSLLHASQVLIEHFKLPYLLLLSYIYFKTISKTDDLCFFPFCFSKGHYWSEYKSDWKTRNPEISVMCLYVTDLLNDVFNTKGVHGNPNKSKQVTLGVTFHHLNTRMSMPLCPGSSWHLGQLNYCPQLQKVTHTKIQQFKSIFLVNKKTQDLLSSECSFKVNLSLAIEIIIST